MDIIAKSTVRVAPRKIRLVADSVRSLSLDDALNSLSVIKNRGAVSLGKTLESAAANAVNNNKLERNTLKIKSINVLEAPSYKRYHPSTRGRVHTYKRRGSHIEIVLTNGQSEAKNEKLQKVLEKVNKKEEKKS